MVFRNFRTNVVTRIVLILFFGYLSVYIALYTHFWLVSFWTTLISAILLVNLIKFVERSNREMTTFLLSIKQGDFSGSYAPNRGGNTQELHRAFDEIIDVFQKLSSERETNHLFLQTVLEHVSIALLTFDEKGEVISINRSAKQLFQKPYVKHLDSIEKIDRHLYQRLMEIGPDEAELIKLVHQGNLLTLSLRATNFILKGKKYKIVSLQDIKSELEEQEVQSWQKLIRVLTHEIMNSAIPISTLSSVISQLLVDGKGDPVPLSELGADALEDVIGGLKTIENRSKGLVKFLDAYKSLTKIDPPQFENLKVRSLVDDVVLLLTTELQESKVKISLEVDDSIEIMGDKQLLEQVLINLLKNAMDAMVDQKAGSIRMRTKRLGNGRVSLSVEDDGPGIEPEVLENIFVPFFSTKKKGSGIGLSLSRQIMRLHKGSITAKSTLGSGSIFILTF